MLQLKPFLKRIVVTYSVRCVARPLRPTEAAEGRPSIRMTKEEVRQESKNTEGDPKVKARIRARQRQIARRRMMQAVPTADVVITNPTHFAVALKYDPSVANNQLIFPSKATYDKVHQFDSNALNNQKYLTAWQNLISA